MNTVFTVVRRACVSLDVQQELFLHLFAHKYFNMPLFVLMCVTYWWPHDRTQIIVHINIFPRFIQPLLAKVPTLNLLQLKGVGPGAKLGSRPIRKSFAICERLVQNALNAHLVCEHCFAENSFADARRRRYDKHAAWTRMFICECIAYLAGSDIVWLTGDFITYRIWNFLYTIHSTAFSHCAHPPPLQLTGVRVGAKRGSRKIWRRIVIWTRSVDNALNALVCVHCFAANTVGNSRR